MISLTAQQQKAFAFIAEYIRANGYAPSYDEIANGIGLSAKSGVHRLVECLCERGYLRRIPNRPRALEIVGAAKSTVDFSGSKIAITPSIEILLLKYCAAQKITREVAVNELLRYALGDAA